MTGLKIEKYHVLFPTNRFVTEILYSPFLSRSLYRDSPSRVANNLLCFERKPTSFPRAWDLTEPTSRHCGLHDKIQSLMPRLQVSHFQAIHPDRSHSPTANSMPRAYCRTLDSIEIKIFGGKQGHVSIKTQPLSEGRWKPGGKLHALSYRVIARHWKFNREVATLIPEVAGDFLHFSGLSWVSGFFASLLNVFLSFHFP